MKTGHARSALEAAIAAKRTAFKQFLFFSASVNLLMLAPALYMLQVYGRVIDSRSLSTLAMLTLLVLGAYLLLELLEWTRGRILHAVASEIDETIRATLFGTVFEARLKRIQGASTQAFTDLRTVRDFIASPTLAAIIDAPLALFFLVLIFAIHPLLGWFSMAGVLVLTGLTWLTERSTQKPLARAGAAANVARDDAANILRNAQVIAAMGMADAMRQRWLYKQYGFLQLQAEASDKGANFASLSRFVQLAQSSLLLGLGCWLFISNRFPDGAGLIIVASILGGRILSPLVKAIASWRQIASARDAYARLNRLLLAVSARQPGMPLPAPQGHLSVEGLVAKPPGAPSLTIRGVSFALRPGEMLAVVGTAASGKSSLARLLVGAWPAAGGTVRLDGADVFAWHKSELGPHIGYLPQEIELFDGTVAENIGRFGLHHQPAIEAAAKAAGMHETILTLPEGYATRIGDAGCLLSGGQRQRVGLARAVCGNPQLVVLDEPDSSLDEAGAQALKQLLTMLKARHATIVVITHRDGLLEVADLMLWMKDGQGLAFGPRDEVLAQLRPRKEPRPQLQARATVVPASGAGAIPVTLPAATPAINA